MRPSEAAWWRTRLTLFGDLKPFDYSGCRLLFVIGGWNSEPVAVFTDARGETVHFVDCARASEIPELLAALRAVKQDSLPPVALGWSRVDGTGQRVLIMEQWPGGRLFQFAADPAVCPNLAAERLDELQWRDEWQQRGVFAPGCDVAGWLANAIRGDRMQPLAPLTEPQQVGNFRIWQDADGDRLTHFAIVRPGEEVREGAEIRVDYYVPPRRETGGIPWFVGNPDGLVCPQDVLFKSRLEELDRRINSQEGRAMVDRLRQVATPAHPHLLAVALAYLSRRQTGLGLGSWREVADLARVDRRLVSGYVETWKRVAGFALPEFVDTIGEVVAARCPRRLDEWHAQFYLLLDRYNFDRIGLVARELLACEFMRLQPDVADIATRLGVAAARVQSDIGDLMAEGQGEFPPDEDQARFDAEFTNRPAWVRWVRGMRELLGMGLSDDEFRVGREMLRGLLANGVFPGHEPVRAATGLTRSRVVAVMDSLRASVAAFRGALQRGR
jgi:hypothetical protein